MLPHKESLLAAARELMLDRRSIAEVFDEAAQASEIKALRMPGMSPQDADNIRRLSRHPRLLHDLGLPPSGGARNMPKSFRVDLDLKRASKAQDVNQVLGQRHYSRV